MSTENGAKEFGVYKRLREQENAMTTTDISVSVDMVISFLETKILRKDDDRIECLLYGAAIQFLRKLEEDE